jgi:hypothetical protein
MYLRQCVLINVYGRDKMGTAVKVLCVTCPATPQHCWAWCSSVPFWYSSVPSWYSSVPSWYSSVLGLPRRWARRRSAVHDRALGSGGTGNGGAWQAGRQPGGGVGSGAVQQGCLGDTAHSHGPYHLVLSAPYDMDYDGIGDSFGSPAANGSYRGGHLYSQQVRCRSVCRSVLNLSREYQLCVDPIACVGAGEGEEMLMYCYQHWLLVNGTWEHCLHRQ